MNVKRVTRLLRLLQTLQSGQGQNADGLAHACGVSRRTVFRDIESLREAGVPVAYDSDSQRYRIDSAHFLPPTNLTMEEALSLLVVVNHASSIDGAPLLASASDAAAKIETSLPDSMQSQLRALTSSVTIKAASRNPLYNKQGVYRTLLSASADRQAVCITYDSFTDYDQIETEFHPFQLLFHSRSWYAIGRSVHHEGIRTFNLGRILSAELIDKPFKIPRSFSISNYLRNAWGLIPESGPDQKVQLRFSSLVARNVSEVLWHPLQQCEFTEDGSLDFHVEVSGLREIIWWILGYGDQVEVIKPARLRRMVAQRLLLAASRYANSEETPEAEGA